jgi:hypothetical protein
VISAVPESPSNNGSVMGIKPIGLVFSVVLALPPAKAEFIISIQQDGANVVAIGSAGALIVASFSIYALFTSKEDFM